MLCRICYLFRKNDLEITVDKKHQLGQLFGASMVDTGLIHFPAKRNPKFLGLNSPLLSYEPKTTKFGGCVS